MMRWRRERADVHALVGAYVLNSLDATERAAVERHLRACEVCAAEVVELRNTATNLSFPAMSQPGPQLRDRLLAEIRQTPQVPPIPQSRPGGVTKRAWARPRPLVVMAVLILFAVIVAALTIDLGPERRSSRDDVAAVLSAVDATSRSVTAGDSTMTVISSRKQNAGIVVMARPPALPPGKIFQLWYLRGGDVRSAGLMSGSETSRLITGIGDASKLGVTVEPASGSAVPSASPLLSIEL